MPLVRKDDVGFIRLYSLRQREGHQLPAGGAAGFSAAGGDHHVLPAVDHVGAGGGVAAEGQFGFPQDLAGVLVERAESFVRGGTNEDQAAGLLAFLPGRLLWRVFLA